MSMTDKLQHLGALNNRLGAYEERLASLVTALGGPYPVATPEGSRGANLTQAGGPDNDSMLQTFEGHNRFAVFVLDRVEQHLAHLQQYVHGEARDAGAVEVKGRATLGEDFRRKTDETFSGAPSPSTIVVDGVTFIRA